MYAMHKAEFQAYKESQGEAEQLAGTGSAEGEGLKCTPRCTTNPCAMWSAKSGMTDT